MENLPKGRRGGADAGMQRLADFMGIGVSLFCERCLPPELEQPMSNPMAHWRRCVRFLPKPDGGSPLRAACFLGIRIFSLFVRTLAAKQRLRVAPVPPQATDLTPPATAAVDEGRPGRRNRRSDRTNKDPLRRTSGFPTKSSPDNVKHWWKGKTINVTYTEILIVPR